MLKTLHIMRGVSGSGKSTATQALIDSVTRNIGYSDNHTVVHSTDSVIERDFDDYGKFFNEMNESNDFSMLGTVHRRNQLEATESMEKGVTHVIIDNTNLTRKEFKPYVKVAEANGYNVVIHNIQYAPLTAEDLFRRNTHNVPMTVIENMIRKFDLDPNMQA
jgi:predicted kinase